MNPSIVIHRKNLNLKFNICKLSDLNCVLIGSLYSKLNWQSIVEAIKVCWPKNLLKTWAKFKPVTRHHSWQRGMSDFDMYILPLLCNHNENYYCWSSMIMSSYFNVFAPKKLWGKFKKFKRKSIYADIVQNPTFLGRFQT